MHSFRTKEKKNIRVRQNVLKSSVFVSAKLLYAPIYVHILMSGDELKLSRITRCLYYHFDNV